MTSRDDDVTGADVTAAAALTANDRATCNDESLSLSRSPGLFLYAPITLVCGLTENWANYCPGAASNPIHADKCARCFTRGFCWKIWPVSRQKKIAERVEEIRGWKIRGPTLARLTNNRAISRDFTQVGALFAEDIEFHGTLPTGNGEFGCRLVDVVAT